MIGSESILIKKGNIHTGLCMYKKYVCTSMHMFLILETVNGFVQSMKLISILNHEHSIIWLNVY